MMLLPLSDPVALTAALVDVPSVSGSEGQLADAIEHSLRAHRSFTLLRDGDAVVASTHHGHKQRVLLAGHLDTVPIIDNVPSTQDEQRIYGCGSTDMKSGIAVMLFLATLFDTEPSKWADITLVFYDNEEVAFEHSGLGRIMRSHPEALGADAAIVLEPTSGVIEAGCQGTLRAQVLLRGRRAHSARSWLGVNAIHDAGEVLRRLEKYEPRSVTIDGCTYREGLNAVGIAGGVASNVIPDEVSITVNFRFAPDRSEADAVAHVREVLGGYDIEILDSAPGAEPSLNSPMLRRFCRDVGTVPVAKYGWTDVARLATIGIPALNYGPGEPGLAHTREESVEISTIREVAERLRHFLLPS